MKGNFLLPFKAAFAEGKLVLTGFFKERQDIKSALQRGDIISSINGVPVDSLVRKWLPLTPASNYAAQLRDLTAAYGFLMRSPQEKVVVGILRNGKIMDIPLRTMNKNLSDENMFVIDKPAYSLTGDIGYISPSRLKETDFYPLRMELGFAKGIIVDLRCYPAVFMPMTYGEWFKDSASAFVNFTGMDFQEPGNIFFKSSVENGATGGEHYKGKLIILVNSITQSQAEYTTMALQSVRGAMVVGSQTAGADGNVSPITLPGGIRTAISGLGVYYPDGGETQRTGLRIDVPVEPTIEGIRQGKDELMEKAIELIRRRD
jgi:C-terminal processing protease CtpA/Prc